MSEAIFGLIGVLLGGVLTTAGTVWVRHRERQAEAVVLARSLRAEIASLLKLVERQGFVPEMRDMLNESRATDTWWRKWVKAEEDYFAVYRANVSRLGLLSGIQAEKVVEFYTLCMLWVEDMRDGHTPESQERAIQQLEANLKTLERTINIGEEAISLLPGGLRPSEHATSIAELTR